MTYSFSTKPGTAASVTIPTKAAVAGYTLTVEFSYKSSFGSLITTKSVTGSGNSVSLALTGADVDSIKDAHYRVKGVNGGNTVYLQTGTVDYEDMVNGSGGSSGTTYFNGAASGLSATDVQAAIDEVVADYQAADAATITAARNGVILETDISVVDRGHGIASAEETMSRTALSGNFNVSTGVLYLAYFTPRASRTVTTVEVITAGTAGSPAPTLGKLGLYSVDGSGNLTLMSSSVNDTTLFTAASTAYAKTLAASKAIIKGQRYAVAALQIGSSTAPKVYGVVTVGTVNSRTPALAHQVGSQTDMPSSVSAGSLASTTGMMWAAVY